MDKVSNYITKLRSLYRLDDRVLTALDVSKDRISKQLAPYSWEDINHCLERFYATKDSANYPRLEQILALLNTDRAVYKENPNEYYDIPMPRTNISFLQDVFMDVCRYIHRQGIIWVEYCAKIEKIPYGNKMFVQDIKSSDGRFEQRLSNKEWIMDDMIKEKEKSFHDIYHKFPGMRKMEKYAFAHKFGVFRIK